MTTSEARGDAIAALLHLTLDRGADETLSRQLYRQLRELILSGRLVGGARLPSTRQLAIDLGVSRTVTLAAFDQLASEGYLEPRRGSGQYVQQLERRATAPPPPDRAERQAEPEASTRGRPFDPVVPAHALFPLDTWSRLMARSWRRQGADAIGVDHWGGLPALRAAIAEHLRVMQGLDCTADQVVVTGGSDDSVQLIVRALGLRGAEGWVENPGHVGTRRALGHEGVAPRPVPVDAEGFDVAAAQKLWPQARLAVVTPSRQFPLGMPLSLPRRLALIDWARESGATIIEDDYDSELRFSGRPMASLLGLDPQGSVFSIGSFSKLTFPGLRLGYVACAAQLADRLIDARRRQGIPVATSAQPALAAFIAEGHFSKHLGDLRRQIAHRRSVMIAALRDHLGDRVIILPQEVGMHLTILLPDASGHAARDAEIAAAAAERGLNVEPLSAHAFDGERRQGFLLGYAAWDDAMLTRGVAELARLAI